MATHEVRKRRIVWLAAAVVLASLGLSTLTGVAFLDILKPLASLIAIGMLLWWVAYEVADWNPYRYG